MWVTFRFDGNNAWGMVDGPEEWKRIQDAYKASSGADLRNARSDSWSLKHPEVCIPSFGFRREHDDYTLTLWHWASTNSMTEQLFGEVQGACSSVG